MMKRFLALLMTVVLVQSLFVGFGVSSSAAPAFVEKEYSYKDVQAEWGNEETKKNPVFCGGLWMFEWYHEVDGTFGVMESWFDKTPEGVGSSTMTNFYTAIENSYEEYSLGAGTLDDYYFCAIRYNGKGMHPGINVAAVITFVCPADGQIRFTVKGRPNGANNSAEKNSTGNHLYLFQDETLVYEVEEAFYSEDKATYDVDQILNVKEGQKIRYAIGANGSRGSKGWDMTELPVVSYVEASVPIGDPAGNAPSGISFPERTATTATITWEAMEGVDGYNVYLGEKKMNGSLITGTSFVIEGLEPGTAYDDITVTSVTGSVESAKSESKSVRTRKDDGSATGGNASTEAEKSSSAATDAVQGTGEGSGDKGAGVEAWVIFVIIGGVILLGAIIAMVVVMTGMMKKMKALTQNDGQNTKHD